MSLFCWLTIFVRLVTYASDADNAASNEVILAIKVLF